MGTEFTTKERIELSLAYLKELQAGRVKPDKHQNHRSISDSLDNIGDIKIIKKTINSLLAGPSDERDNQ